MKMSKNKVIFSYTFLSRERVEEKKKLKKKALSFISKELLIIGRVLSYRQKLCLDNNK